MNFLIFKILKFCIPIFCISIILTGIGFSTISLLKDSDMERDGHMSNAAALKNGTLDKVLYTFLGKIGKKFKKQYGINSFGAGGGATSEGIWLMSLSFNRYGDPFTEEEARKLIIDCSRNFLDSVNNDEQLKSFLRDYPFTSKNIDLSIFNYGKNNLISLFPSVAIVGNANGKIGYFTEDPSTQPRYHTKKYETYEEAVAILRQESQ